MSHVAPVSTTLAVNIKNVLSFLFASVSIPLASVNGAIQKTIKSNLYRAIDSLSDHTISLESFTGVSYCQLVSFIDIFATLREVKNVPKTFKDLLMTFPEDITKFVFYRYLL